MYIALLRGKLANDLLVVWKYYLRNTGKRSIANCPHITDTAEYFASCMCCYVNDMSCQ